MTISATIDPVPFKRVMQSGKRRFNDPRYTEYKEALGYFARQAMAGREPFTGLIALHADFYKPVKKVGSPRFGDTDNFLKAVLDALQGICFLNDAQVIDLHGTKHYGEPHITIVLSEINHETTTFRGEF